MALRWLIQNPRLEVERRVLFPAFSLGFSHFRNHHPVNVRVPFARVTGLYRTRMMTGLLEQQVRAGPPNQLCHLRVVLPARDGKLEFVYKPESFTLGLWLAAFMVIILSGWVVVGRLWRRASMPDAAGTTRACDRPSKAWRGTIQFIGLLNPDYGNT